MQTDELYHNSSRTERQAVTRKRKCSKFWKRTKKRCKKAWKLGVDFWDWLGSEEFEDDEVQFLRRILRLKYIISSLLLLLAVVIGIHVIVVLLK